MSRLAVRWLYHLYIHKHPSKKEKWKKLPPLSIILHVSLKWARFLILSQKGRAVQPQQPRFDQKSPQVSTSHTSIATVATKKYAAIYAAIRGARIDPNLEFSRLLVSRRRWPICGMRVFFSAILTLPPKHKTTWFWHFSELERYACYVQTQITLYVYLFFIPL